MKQLIYTTTSSIEEADFEARYTEIRIKNLGITRYLDLNQQVYKERVVSVQTKYYIYYREQVTLRVKGVNYTIKAQLGISRNNLYRFIKVASVFIVGNQVEVLRLIQSDSIRVLYEFN